MATIGLGRDVEVVLGKVGELLEEVADKGEVVIGSHIITPVNEILVGLREANASGLLNVDKVRQAVPRSATKRKSTILVRLKWTMFSKFADQARAARATVGPDDNRISSRIALRLNKPIKDLASTFSIHGNVARKLTEVQLGSTREIEYFVLEHIRRVDRGACAYE